jgi:hypothetical protein
MMFFYKMAVLLCLTVVFSALFSLVWMMALLALIGPEGHTGDLNAMCGREGTNLKNTKVKAGNAIEPSTSSSDDINGVNPTFDGNNL